MPAARSTRRADGRRRRRASPSTCAHERARCALARELAEADLLDAALGPELREELVHLGAREREHHAAADREVAQRRVDELHRGQVAPVQVLEHEQHGLRRALGARGSPRRRGASGRPSACASLPRRAELARSRRRGTARRRARRGTRRRAAPRAAATWRATRARSLRGAPSSGSPSRMPAARRSAWREHAERRAGAHRIAAADPDLDGLAARCERARGTRGGGAILPTPGGAGHEHRARDGLVDALVEDRLERARARARGRRTASACRAACARPRDLALAAEHRARLRLAHVEARVEQPRGDLVEADERGRPRARPGAIGEQARGAIDRLADGQAPGALAAARGQRDRRAPARSRSARAQRAARAA